MSLRMRLHPLKVFGCLLGSLLVAACGGVLEVQIERVPSNRLAALGQVAYISGGDVWLLDLDSGEQTRLTQDGHNRRPRLSPDGNWVAYLKTDQLFIKELAGGNEHMASEAGISDYAWSPKGGLLAYGTTSGFFIWDGRLKASREIPVGLAALNRVAWHPIGESIALDNREGALRGVLRVSLDGMDQGWVFSTEDLMNVPRLAGWSPDGRWVALWVGSRAQATEQDGLPLCMTRAEGGDLHCVEERGLLQPDYLTWSPDGRLAYISGSGRETWVAKRLTLLDVDTMALQTLISADEQGPLHPDWSPDGAWIVYSAGPATPLGMAYQQIETALNGRRIWSIDVASGRRRQLTNDKSYRDERPTWSSDGSHILFVRMDNTSASLWLMQADGSGLHPVVPELTRLPDAQGDYGYIDWGNWWDWNRP